MRLVYLLECITWLLLLPLTNLVAEPRNIQFSEITSNIWLYTAYTDVPGFPNFPENGAIAISNKEAIILDLPSTIEDTVFLFDWVEQKGATVKYVVPLHWHGDSIGGLSVAFEQHADVVMLEKTVDILSTKEPVLPTIKFSEKILLEYGTDIVELVHLGGGHTTDNVVAWLGNSEVLIGGCLIKSANSKSLGNLADADMENYLSTVIKVKESYPDAKVVTPGHGNPGGMNLIDHTIKLLEAIN